MPIVVQFLSIALRDNFPQRLKFIAIHAATTIIIKIKVRGKGDLLKINLFSHLSPFQLNASLSSLYIECAFRFLANH
jgi:hypothetical protein